MPKHIFNYALDITYEKEFSAMENYMFKPPLHEIQHCRHSILNQSLRTIVFYPSSIIAKENVIVNKV